MNRKEIEEHVLGIGKYVLGIEVIARMVCDLREALDVDEKESFEAGIKKSTTILDVTSLERETRWERKVPSKGI